jgi:hypothetical protein
MQRFPLNKAVQSSVHRFFRSHPAVSCALLCCMLVACGSSGSAPQTSTRNVVTTTVVTTTIPSPTPTALPTPSPTPKPTPTPLPQRTAPAILDLQPASMSLIGHLDCKRTSVYVCTARVLSRASNSSNLHWVAFTNIAGHITFSPVSGVLAPGHSVFVTIFVPFTSCTHGLFFFQGPINTHTITWAC